MSHPQFARLRRDVRELIDRSGVALDPQCDAWLFGHDLDFTTLLGSEGFIGATWPQELGGRELSNVERLVVTEELLRVGAPVAAHWIADRQIGPAILRYGSEELQREFLPRIAAGEVTFCLGMSESESGSDLAAVRTRAVAVEGGFRITGQKIWTSHAHRATHAYVLARTGAAEDKHGGLTEFVVDLSSPGVQVRPILDLHGEHHFNETVFEDVFVPSGHVIGEVGEGWRQVTEQLSFERGGMERVLSTFPLLALALRDGWVDADADAEALGELVARLHALRGLAVEVAGLVDTGEAPVRRAAMLKFLGTAFEGDIVEFCRRALDRPPLPAAGAFDTLLAQGITRSPGATLRGGTTEILLGIVARGVGDDQDKDDLAEMVTSALQDVEPRTEDWREDLWRRASELGWTSVGVSEESGGSGGDLADLVSIVRAIARCGLSAPVAESALAAASITRAGAQADVTVPRAVAASGGLVMTEKDRPTVSGKLVGVPWAHDVDEWVLVAESAAGPRLVRLAADAAGLTRVPRWNLAGEPCADLVLDGVELESDAVIGEEKQVRQFETALLTVRCGMLVGAMELAVGHATEHAAVREQFGRPLKSFQAVAHLLARADAEVTLARVALNRAVCEATRGGAGWRAIAAHVRISEAATVVARASHQILGAMGMTREHALHLATLRLWSWRDAPTGRRRLAAALGRAALEAGDDGLWEWLTEEHDDLVPRTKTVIK